MAAKEGQSELHINVTSEKSQINSSLRVIQKKTSIEAAMRFDFPTVTRVQFSNRWRL